MADQIWTLTDILNRWGIILETDALDLGERHFTAAKFHWSLAHEIGSEHESYSWHAIHWKAQLAHALGVVHDAGDFSKVEHEDDLVDLCCKESWSPKAHLLSEGFYLADPFIISGFASGHVHPADNLLNSLEPAQEFWTWYDKVYGPMMFLDNVFEVVDAESDSR